MSRWFRYYDDALNDPKVQTLPGELFKTWVNLLCVASKNEGKIPPIYQLTYLLRRRSDMVVAHTDKLVELGLLDLIDDHFEPHNWGGRQYISDSSAARVQRHRDKRKKAGLQSQWTCPKQLRYQVYLRDGFACVYCGSDDDITLDHKIPERRGGTHDIDNLQTACRKCNAAKRDLTHEEYVSRNDDVTLLKRHQTTETEQNKAEKKERTGKTILPGSWSPSPVHFQLAEKLGLPSQSVEDAAAEMRDWSVGNGEKRTNWDSAFSNWLRRNAQRRHLNGHGRQGPLQDNRSLSQAAGRLAEAAERGEFTFGPRPGLRAATDSNVVRLLPPGGSE